IGWRFVGVYTRSEFAVQPSTRNPGDEVSYVARWINRRGEPGAFGLLVIQRIRFNIAPFNTPQPSRRRRAA
ncbi:MAG TPA: hypothetical protein PK402_08690, partial [Tepidisphaeraceae bacterium]|nr:hypothetical protein [Tepidisphaeraceae bacterium]